MKKFKKNCLEVVLSVALILLLMGLCSGCTTSWAKGQGALLRCEISVCEAPISAKGGANYGSKPGPAEAIAKEPLVDPKFARIVQVGNGTTVIRPIGR